MKDPLLTSELNGVNPWPHPSHGSNDRFRHALRANLERELSGQTLSSQSAPPGIPDHTLLECIGIGAYGEVWLAESALGALRAVKIVYRNRFDDDRPFEREFNGILRYEPVSRTHSSLVAVLQAGRNDTAGYFYYVMELADNANEGDSAPSGTVPPWRTGFVPRSYKPKTLRSVLEQGGRLPPVEAAQLGVHLAEALAHLHARGLVHRDIKPSNIIFIGGTPKLADIGLITGTGDSRSFVGTEGFIPPEGPGTTRADVFGLGKLLYELSTGRDRLDFPQLPAAILTLPEREALLELNEVITKACAPDPLTRYATATELAADLNLFLSGRSLRETRLLSRRLSRLTHCALAACVLLILALGAMWLARNATLQAQQREEDSKARAAHEVALRQRAESAEKEARQQLYSALLEQARATIRSGEWGQRFNALEAIRRAAAIANSAELRREALAAFALADVKPIRYFPLSAGRTLARLDPALMRLAVCAGTDPVEILDVGDQRVLAALPASANLPAYFATWSPDGRFLAVKRGHATTDRNLLEVWETSGLPLLVLSAEADYGAVSFHPLLPRLMGAVPGGTIVLWDLHRAAEIQRLELELPQRPDQLAFAPDGDRFATSQRVGGGSIVTVYDSSDGTRLVSREMLQQVASVDWHPEGRWLAVADHGSSVSLVDTESGATRLLGRHKLQAVTTAFSPGGRYLFTGGWEREIICWDLWTKERALTISMDGFAVQFSSDGRTCVITARDGLNFCSFEAPAGCRDFSEDLGGRVHRAVFSPDGRFLAASGQERLGLWDLRSQQSGALLSEGADSRVFFSADSRLLLASRDDGCYAWELHSTTGALISTSPRHLSAQTPQGFTSLCVASNQMVFTCSLGSRLLGYDTPPSRGDRWSDTINGVNGASPDGRFLGVFRPYTPWMNIYSLPGFECLAVLTNLTNIREFEFSASGDQIAVSSSSGIACWNTTTWQPARHITGFVGALFTPGGKTAWFTKDFRSAGLYSDFTQGSLLPLPPGILPLALTADGQFLALSRDAQRLQVWDINELGRQLQELGIGF